MTSPPPLPERTGLSSPKMNINRELLKLMRPGRIGGNRRCADCDAELKDYGNIWASVEQGCFVCVHCVAGHRALGFRTKSVNMDLWAVDEVARMTAMGNLKVNEIYERYVPSSWHKPTPDADQHQREQWILAKYKHRYFMLPHYGEQGVASKGYLRTASVSQTLPIRLVDYFVVVGPGGLVLDERVTPASTPEDIEFREEMLDCFPEADSHLGCPIPEHLPQFVFPDGMRMSSQEPPPTSFPFVLTNSNGLKMHGAVLHVAAEIDSHQVGGMVSRALSSGRDGSSARDGAFGSHSPKAPLSPAQLPAWLRDTMATPERTGGDNRARARASRRFQQLYAPKALVLLSHYPFYNLCSQFLQQIYRIGLSEAPLPIERYISNFVCEVPLPPQGQVEVSYALPDRTLTISRPPKNRLPLVDFSYRPLFASLSVDNILCTFGLLLTEAKVALCSSHYALLTPAAEGLLSLLFPFVWQGAYIPVMPFNMRDVLEAPVPFLVGIHSRYLLETDSTRRPLGVVFVDLDNDTIDLGVDEDIGAPRRRPNLPEREASKLRQKLNEFSPAARRARPSHSSAAFGSSSFPSASGGVGQMTSFYGVASLTDSTRGSSISTVATAVVGVGGGAGGGVGVGMGSVGGTGVAGEAGGISGGVAFSLDTIDLAFPNNEHLLPISTFSTEQGLTVSSSRSQRKSAKFMARVTSQRLKPLKKKKDPSRNTGVAVRFGSQESTSMLDPANDVNAPDGFSAPEIRAAFLRFFVSIFRGYLAHVVMPTTNSLYPEKLFNKEAFLKSCGHLAESSHSFMSALLDNQMFEKFLEERTADPTQAEVRFFDESIAAKLNRSKTNPIKKDTPFLNDQSDVHNQVFTPPAPSNWGLPDDGSQYAYGLSFPRLNKDRYGTVRWAKRLFKTPDQHRNVSSVNHQRLLNGARFGKRSKRKGSEVTMSIGASTPKPAKSYPRSETDAVIRGIVRLQALYRMHQGKTSFRAQKEAAVAISRAWRNWQSTYEDRMKVYTIIFLVKDIQRVYRGHLARRKAAARLQSVCRLQAWQRMLVLRRGYRRLRRAAEIVQAVARGRNCRVAFLVVRELIILAQAAVRGWLERRLAARQRKTRVGELRTQIFELWIRAFTPLVYRSKFWVLFQGSDFLDLAVHEEEALRLWRDLGLVDHEKEHLARVHFNQTFKFVNEWLRTTRPAAATSVKEIARGKGASLSSTWSPLSSATPAAAAAATAGTGDHNTASLSGFPSSETPPPRSATDATAAADSPVSPFRPRVKRTRNSSVAGAMKRLGNGANLGLTSGVLATLGLTGLRRGSTASMSSTAASMRGGLGGQPSSVARQAAERVFEERDRLYAELKRETEDGTKVSLFSLFGLEKQKRRKRKLVDVLWFDRALAEASAEVVLSVFRDHLEARHAWVENKRDARIRADLLCTVQACILSLQRLKQNPPSNSRNVVLANAVANRASTMGDGGGMKSGGSLAPRSETS